ncbi:unnamed protein product, partial [Polarella glacialis]
VASHLLQKGFCVVQCFLQPQVQHAARASAQQQTGWKRLIKELEPAYLGREPLGKAAWLPQTDRSEAPDSLEACDRMLSELLAGLCPEAVDTFRFAPDGRSEGLLRMPFRSRSEEDEILWAREVLTEEMVASGKIEEHIEFVQTRKICALFAVAGADNRLSLHREDGSSINFSLESGQMVVFRHDLLSFSYVPGQDSMAIQAWLFSLGYTTQLQ